MGDKSPKNNAKAKKQKTSANDKKVKATTPAPTTK